MSKAHTDDRSGGDAPSPPDERFPPERGHEPSDEAQDEHPLEADYPDADDSDGGDTD